MFDLVCLLLLLVILTEYYVVFDLVFAAITSDTDRVLCCV